MKLYLAVAVLILALAAQTEAQAADATIEQRFADIGNQMSEFTKDWVNKAKTTFEEIPDSDFATSVRTWMQDQLEKAKAKYQELTQN